VSVDYGVRFGPSFTSLSSVETFDPEIVARANEPTMNFGGFVTVDLPGPLSLQPEILFAARGQRVHDKDAQPEEETGQPRADRVVLLRFLEIPMLLRLSKQTRPSTSLYLIGGPAFAFSRNAVIREVADSGDLEDISTDVTSTTFSVIVGGGIAHGRWLADARYVLGLQNVAVDPTPAAVKASAFTVLMGIRF
jgi:hypothetical protein